jgi:drug/metabolite transporter (DMT)-like permease
MQVKKTYTTLDWSLLVFVSLAWGSADLLAKKGLKVFAPNEVGMLRIFVASLLFTPIAMARIKNISFVELCKYLLVGLLGSVLPAFVCARSQAKLDSSINTALNALTPIFTLLLAMFFFRRKISLNEMYGIIVGFLGTIILVSSGVGSSHNNIKYALFPIIGSICYALSTNLVSCYLNKTDILTATSISLIPYCIIMGITLFTQTDVIYKLDMVEGAYKALGFVVAVAVCSSCLAFLTFNILTRNTSPVFASMSTLIAPVISLIWGLLDGEDLCINHYIGIFTILSGVYLLHRTKPAKNSSS